MKQNHARKKLYQKAMWFLAVSVIFMIIFIFKNNGQAPSIARQLLLPFDREWVMEYDENGNLINEKIIRKGASKAFYEIHYEYGEQGNRT